MNLPGRDTSTMVTSGQMSTKAIEKLVKRAQAGDGEAFTVLVGKYKDSIYNYVARMVHDRTEAEDIAQEAFIKAYQALPEFRGTASFQTWLYRIASNLAIDAARRRGRRGSLSLDEPVNAGDGQMVDQLADEEPGPLAQVESWALQQLVQEAIVELSPKLRAVVVMYDLEGLSYQEVAEILGCPLGTVKSRLFNARNQLQEKLAARLPLEDLPLP